VGRREKLTLVLPGFLEMKMINRCKGTI